MKKMVVINMNSGQNFNIVVEESELPELLKVLGTGDTYVDLLKFLPAGAKSPFDAMVILTDNIASVLIGNPEIFKQKPQQIKIPFFNPNAHLRRI